MSSTTDELQIDSDATVAPEEDFKIHPQSVEEMLVNVEGDEEGSDDSSSPASPSILHPRHSVLLHSNAAKKKHEDTVPCSSSSSDEAASITTNGEEVLSQEFPLQGADEGEHCLTALNKIARDQDMLISSINSTLDNYGEIFPSNFAQVTRDKVSEMEKKLKVISESHQDERKRLMGIHTQLSQGASQGEGLAEGSQTLRSQLVSLSTRQKELLQCLRKHKEISNKLGNLEKREMNSRKIVEPPTRHIVTSHNVQNSNLELPITIPNLLKHFLPSHPLADSGRLALNSAAKNPVEPVVQSCTEHSNAGSTCQVTKTHIPPMVLNTASPVGIAKPPPLGMADLTQLVPLDVLIKHQILEAGPKNLNCVILGCEFTGSLLEDGSIQEVHTQGSPAGVSGGQHSRHQAPQQWAKACWARLGHHHKKPTKKQTYNIIFYKGKVLSYYCKEYSCRQVSSYLSHKRSHDGDSALTKKATNTQLDPEKDVTNLSNTQLDVDQLTRTNLSSSSQLPTTNPPALNVLGPPDNSQVSHVPQNTPNPLKNSQHHQIIPIPPKESSLSQRHRTLSPPPTARSEGFFDLGALLHSGEVLLVSSANQSLQLPRGFWKEEGKESFPPIVLRQIESDLDW